MTKSLKRWLGWAFVLMLVLVGPGARAQVGGYGPPTEAQAQRERMAQAAEVARNAGLPANLEDLMSSRKSAGTAGSDMLMPDVTRILPTTAEPQKLSNSIMIVLLLSLLTLAPSILLMTTCFTRVVIVMSLLRQALGANQLPPNQVMIGLSLFITFLVMGPTWTQINKEAIQPYREGKMTQLDAFDQGIGVMRWFMIRQIEAAHNEDDVYLFHSYATRTPDGKPGTTEPEHWSDVATSTLIPAFILSELKVAFLMGFRIFLPFLIIDMVISSVLISIGMQLLPPVMVSLPFKLLLFVLVDGWHLVTATLLSSFN